MLYDHIYFKIYEWVSKMIDPFGPQITTTIILSIFPLSIFYLILKILSLLSIYNFEMGFTTSDTFILFGVIFLILLVVNQIYFFAYKNWKEIIIYFRKNEVTNRVKNLTKIYIVVCTSIYAILFLFLGYKF
jgi:hypothetical protein